MLRISKTAPLKYEVDFEKFLDLWCKIYELPASYFFIRPTPSLKNNSEIIEKIIAEDKDSYPQFRIQYISGQNIGYYNVDIYELHEYLPNDCLIEIFKSFNII